MAGGRGLVKLFGKTIPVLPAEADALASPVEEGEAAAAVAAARGIEELQNHTTEETGPPHKDQESSISEAKTEEATLSTGSENHEPKTIDQDTDAPKSLKPKEERHNTSSPPEKTVKKPDKILPCPRCNSMDTKFCYYNNYNVNQPRHFCRNCQRYWTAGGTMRNVPVGAGRRKNKHSANHHRHIAISEASCQMVCPDITGQVHKPNATVLSFGPRMPICDPMASALNFAEKMMKNYHRNEFYLPEEHISPSSRGGGAAENGEEHSSGSSVTASNLTEDGGGSNLQEPVIQNHPGYPPQVPCLNGTPWPSPWNASSAFCLPSFPVPFYPATAVWGCAIPGAWSIPFLAPLSSSTPNSGSSGSGHNTPTLGKHAREGDALTPSNLTKRTASEQNNGERCLWVPKTLRIDDPEEAAKSSIWASIGIKHDKVDGASRGELFKAFHQPKAEIRSHAAENSMVLHANPAALSRSLNFQESM